MLGLGKKNGFADFSKIASIIAAWSALNTFHAAEDSRRAEVRQLGLVNSFKASEYTAMRRSFGRAREGRMEDFRLPAQGVLDVLESQLEEGEFQAARLYELLSLAEATAATAGKSEASGFYMHVGGSCVKITSR